MSNDGVMPLAHQDDNNTGKQKAAAAQTLIRQIDHFLQLLNLTHEGVVCLDEQGHIVIFNKGAERLFGYKPEEIFQQPFTRLFCPQFLTREKHRLAALTRIARDSQLGFKADRIICMHKDGARFPTEISLSQGKLPDCHLYTLIIHNMSEHIAQEQQLAHLAEYDPLTDLPNRTLLNARLGIAIARADRYGRKLGVVYLDLDNFKPVNDRHGHEVGDHLLQAVARRLSETMRQSDTISRIGGDEFIVCLEYIKNEQDAIAATEKIAATLQQPFQILGRKIIVSASIGIAVYPDHGHDAATLLRHADQAMYCAKADGHGLEVY